ncbi:ABC-2 transporter permease [Bifidobacterium samirii]|uniref:ABC transporter n=1 Tax=Bifidobacterium samirii TaxID=2306974 RepID=A0A430FVK4_9BIFI|nr:ABC-2 transporter permease [Bifidobacterium samirii]RSX57808.1 ABC transporter [Bifidobacterium samirii]
MRRLAAQMRLDTMRAFSQGGAVWFFFILAPTLAFIVPLVTGGINGVTGGGLPGMVSGVGFMLTIYPFLYEEQGEHRRINGLIPIGRARQVAGRYLFVLAWLLVILLDLVAVRVLAWGGAMLSGGVEASGDLGSLGWDIISGAVMPTLVILLMDALVIPLLYRYPLTKVWQIIGIAIVCCIAGGALIAWGAPKLLPASAMDALTKAMGAIADAADASPLGATLVFALVCAAAYELSFLLSRRFNLARNL